MLWEQNNKLWEQYIILREQDIFFSHGLNQPPQNSLQNTIGKNFIFKQIELKFNIFNMKYLRPEKKNIPFTLRKTVRIKRHYNLHFSNPCRSYIFLYCYMQDKICLLISIQAEGQIIFDLCLDTTVNKCLFLK